MKGTDDSLPFMSFPVANWIAATIGLTPQEYTALHKLCCHSWCRNGKLPNDTPSIARLIGITVDELRSVWPAIESWFAKSSDGRTLLIPELEVERQRALELRTKRRRGAEATNARLGRTSADKSDSGSHSDTHSDSLSAPQSDTPSDPLSDTHSETQSDTLMGTLATRPHTSPSPPPSPSPTPHTRLEGSGEPLNGSQGKPSDTRSPSPRRSNPRPS